MYHTTCMPMGQRVIFQELQETVGDDVTSIKSSVVLKMRKMTKKEKLDLKTRYLSMIVIQTRNN
jgi:hypothetical protein